MKILMVCLGNICRSPLAHGILESLATKKGLNWQVDSAGTASWHSGKSPDRRSIAVAKKYNVDISSQKARHFKAIDFDNFDRIYVMDKNNYQDVLALATKEDHRKKVQLFIPNGIVPDPYYDDNEFEPVYQLINQRCIQLLAEEI